MRSTFDPFSTQFLSMKTVKEVRITDHPRRCSRLAALVRRSYVRHQLALQAVLARSVRSTVIDDLSAQHLVR